MKHTRRSVFKSGNRDANQAAIVAIMSQLGPEPIDLSKVGGGVPDLLWPFQAIVDLPDARRGLRVVKGPQ
jgi:hypothetical protein